MDQLKGYIHDALIEAVGKDYHKALIYAEVTPDMVDAMVRFTKLNDSKVRHSAPFESLMDIVARVWETVRANKTEGLWDGIIYFLDNGEERIDLLYRESFDFGMRTVELDKKLRDEYFDGLPLNI